MKKLKLLLLSLLTPLLCIGVSFGASSNMTLIDQIGYGQLQTIDFNYFNSNSFDGYNNLCFEFNGLSNSSMGISANIRYGIQGPWSVDTSQLVTPIVNNSVYCFPLYNYYSDSSTNRQVVYKRVNYSQFQLTCNECYQTSPGGYIFVYGVNTLETSPCPDCSYINTQLSSCLSKYDTLQSDYITLSGSYNTCLNTLNDRNGQVGTLSGQLATCNSDLNSCLSNGSNCDTLYGVCVENLSGCNSDKESLTNYNEALSTQLNECLNNQGSGVNLSGLVLNNNSLFWYLDDSLLSLPINNNLFLPLGYQGALDSGNVLYIKSIDEEEPENYYITPEDKVSIIDILSYIFVFFLGIGIIFSLIKLFKKLFTH